MSIGVEGEVTITVHLTAACRVKVTFVVSSQVYDVILKMDFLDDRACQLKHRDRIFAL